jgi:hypothetical protein
MEAQPDAPSQSAPASPKQSGRMHLTHPGYYSVDSGPAYTPAPPEALAERRARQRPLMSMLRQALSAAASHVQVAVGDVHLQDATLHAYIAGEELPRVFETVTGVRLLSVWMCLNLWGWDTRQALHHAYITRFRRSSFSNLP